MSVALALLASLSWGFADYWGGLVSRSVNGVLILLWMSAAGLPVAVLLALYFGGAPSPADVAWAAAGSAVGTAGVVFYFRALAAGEMSVVAPIAGMVGASVPVIFALLTGERPTLTVLGGVVGAVVAIALVSTPAATESRERPTNRRARFVEHVGARDVRVAVACGCAFGAYFVGLHQTGPTSGMWPVVVLQVTATTELFLFRVIRRQTLALPRAAWPGAAAIGVLYVAADAMFLESNRRGLLSIAAVLSSLYPAVVVVLAWWLLKERLSRARVAGLVLAAVSITLINIGSGHAP